MQSSKKIVFILSLLAGITILSGYSFELFQVNNLEAITLIENCEDTNSDDSSEDKPVYLSTRSLMLNQLTNCTKIAEQLLKSEVKRTYPIWLPPEIC